MVSAYTRPWVEARCSYAVKSSAGYTPRWNLPVCQFSNRTSGVEALVQDGVDRVLELLESCSLESRCPSGLRAQLTNSATSLELPLRDSLCTLDLSLSLEGASFDDIAAAIERCQKRKQQKEEIKKPSGGRWRRVELGCGVSVRDGDSFVYLEGGFGGLRGAGYRRGSPSVTEMRRVGLHGATQRLCASEPLD